MSDNKADRLLPCPFCGAISDQVYSAMIPTDEQVERAAMAIFDADWGVSGWEKTTEGERSLWRAGFRVGITAALGDSVPAWQPIETAPKGGQFLVYLPDEHRKFQVMYRNGRMAAVIGGAFAFDMTKPTHWMPLPTPPPAPILTKDTQCT